MEQRYKVPSAEKAVNKFIAFVFYYRLAFVIISVIAIVIIAVIQYKVSPPGDKLKNAALVFTGGSIIIGIFYSIINYEHNQIRFKHDVKTSREILTFNTACKMHDMEMINHFRAIKAFYQENKNLFVQNRCDEIDKLLKGEKADTRISFVVIFNYLETISIGVQQGIMDEDFMKEFFKTVFRDYYKFYGTYIEFSRKEYNSPRIYRPFTNLAEKWGKEI